MADARQLHDIELNGKKYRIELQSWRSKDIVDFAPRAQTSGQSIIHSELGLYQPFLKTSWRHGFGFFWEEDEEGYMRTEGQVDTRHKGLAMLMSQSNSSDTADAVKEGFVVFNGNLYSFGTGGGGISGVRKFNGSTWADIADSGAGDYGTVNNLLATENQLFVLEDGARIEKLNTSDSASNAGVNSSSTDYAWAVIHQGYIYAGKDGNSVVFRDSNADLSQLAGDTADDPNFITVGGGEMPTIDAIVYQGKLLVSREDGLWHIGDDLNARRMLDFSDQVDPSNFRFMSVFNGKLIFPIRDTLWIWNGSALSDITPPTLTDGFPYTTYGRFDNGVSAGKFFYCTARTNESTYEEHIIAFDGVGWHKLEEPVTNGSDTITAMAFDANNNRLWYHLDQSSDDTRYISFQDQSDFPARDFPTSGTHSLISSRMHVGFTRVIKSTPELIVEASNCSSTNFLTIYYQVDSDGTWHEWGGTGNGDITSNGVIELSNPTGHGNSTLEFNWLQIRVDFTSGSSTETPVLEGFTLRFIMRPKTLYGHSLEIPAATGTKHGTGARQLKSASDIINEIKVARQSKAPIEFVDPYGDRHDVYISAFEMRAVERHDRQSYGKPDIEGRVFLSMVELDSE